MLQQVITSILVFSFCAQVHAVGDVFGTVSPFIDQTINRQAENCECVVALGDAGLKQAITMDSRKPIFAAYITAATYNTIATSPIDRPVTALFAEPNPRLQLALAEVLLGNNQTVTFFSDRSTYLQQVPGQRLVKTRKETLLESISRLDQYRAVMAVPDSSIWNKESFRVVVRALYRQNKVLIGFSRSLVDAGALASFYYEDESYQQEFIAILNTFNKTGKLPASAYPEKYQVAINHQIAKSLNIQIPDNQTILDAIEKVASK